MKCPHCSITFHFEVANFTAYQYPNNQANGSTGWDICHAFCPSCDELIVAMRDGQYEQGGGYAGYLEDIVSTDIIYPRFTSRPVPPEVPEVIQKDYSEAAAVLSLSPKASAAISRRILQNILRDACEVKHGSLSSEIDQFLAQKNAPTYLLEAVDAVRNVGNFAAHPLKDTNTGEIVDVEPGESEWLLDVLDALMDFVFVQPIKLKKQKEQLNEKLTRVGKPLIKT